ncbi:MAG: 50S ribosomal protein L31e, partial [Candidatus Micrarchaeota archaeon]
QKGKGDKAKAEKAPVSKDEPKVERKREIVLERIYIVSLADTYRKPAMQRANYAIKFLKKYLTRHMKAQEGNVKISLILNNFIRKRGSGRPVKKIKIKATKDKDGIVIAETTS